jgi:hypothetical protein
MYNSINIKMASLIKKPNESDWQTPNKYKNRNKAKKPKYFGNGKRNNYRNKKSAVRWREGTTHFIPKGVKQYIDKLFEKGSGSRDFMKDVKKEIKTSSRIWDSTLVYIIHESACRDKLEIIELILDRSSNRSKLVNSKCGPKEFTPIFKSAYKGSIRALKMLLCAGADLTIQNKMGETVIQALNQGNIDTNSRNPEYKIFTDERYSECRDFLENWDPERNNNKVVDENFKAYVPPNKRTKESNTTDSDSLGLSQPLAKIDFTDMNINEFLEMCKSSNDINSYINTTDSPNDTLVNIIIDAAEKDPDIYTNIMSYIGELTEDIIITLINDDNIIDYAKYDAPFMKKKLNKLRNKYLFEEIN